MNKSIAGLIIIAATAFTGAASGTANAAEFRTYTPKQNCYNPRRALQVDATHKYAGIRNLLNSGNIVCDVSRASPLSGAGARAVIRFDMNDMYVDSPELSIDCRFAAVNVWGKEVFFSNKKLELPLYEYAGFTTLVVSLPRTVRNGTLRLTCTLPALRYNHIETTPTDFDAETLYAAPRFPGFTIIEL